MQPADYEAWYHTPRGEWIGTTEFSLLCNLLQANTADSLLDVGCGTGYFTRHFAQQGLHVSAIDPDTAMLAYAKTLSADIAYLQGSALSLPFADQQFDHVSAITSLCFIADPQQALHEMWRVCRKTVVLGLLNRHSLLFLQKNNRGAYRGARWDAAADAQNWTKQLVPPVASVAIRSAIVMPGGNAIARGIESLWPSWLPLGGFLAVMMRKSAE